ncbi:MAG: hypothetical protein KAJ01_04655, partial [Candidatus Hydrogenedentes bacterium]|nr:hypothetical protein [Candidatus Hydrogenedentota bacterium]
MLAYKSRLAATIILSFLVAALFGCTIIALQPLGDVLLGGLEGADRVNDVFDGRLWKTELGQQAKTFIETHFFTNKHKTLLWVAAF